MVEVAASVEVLAVVVMVEVVLVVVVSAAVTVEVSASFDAAKLVVVDVTSNAVVMEALVVVAGATLLAVLVGRDDGDDGMRFQWLVSSPETEATSDDLSDTVFVVVVVSASAGYVLLLSASAGPTEVLIVLKAAMASGVECCMVTILLPFLLTGLESVVDEILENGKVVGLRM